MRFIGIKKEHHNPDSILFLTASTLIIISIIFSYSLSSYISEGSEFKFFIKQFIVGIVSIFIMYYISTHKASKIIPKVGMGVFLVFGFIILIMPILTYFVPSLVSATKGANRWLKLGFISISPVEFFKIGFVYFYALSLSKIFIENENRPTKFLEEVKLLIPHFVLFGIITIFIAYFQKDLGNIVLLFIIFLVMLYFANVSIKLISSILFLAFSSFVLLIIIAPHRIKRISGWYGGIQDTILQFLPKDLAEALKITHFPEPYQVQQSINAIHFGSFSGTGVGEGLFKLGYLSEVHTDFILAGIMEETGIIGIFIILSLVVIMIYRIFSIASKVTNPAYKIFIIGIALIISIAFLINSYGITNIIPIKGIAVPLLSYGGSSLLATSIAIGLVLAMSSEINVKKVN